MNLIFFFIFHRSRKNLPNLSRITLLHSRRGREKELLWIWTWTPIQKYTKKFQTEQKPLRFLSSQLISASFFFHDSLKCQSGFYTLHSQQCSHNMDSIRHNCTYPPSSFPHCFVILKLLHVLQILSVAHPKKLDHSSCTKLLHLQLAT